MENKPEVLSEDSTKIIQTTAIERLKNKINDIINWFGWLNNNIAEALVGAANPTADNHYVTVADITAVETSLLAYPKWIKVATKTFTDFATAGVTRSVDIYNLPSRGYICDAKIIPTTDFSGGAITAVSMSIGIAGELERYRGKQDVYLGNTILGELISPIAGIDSISSETIISATCISTTDNLDQLATGVAEFYLLVGILPTS